MFCKQCGTNLSDDAKFCNACGAKLVEDSNIQVKSASDTPEEKVKKFKYLFTIAPKGIKITNLISWAVGLLCASILVYSYVTVRFSPIYELPILKTISKDAADKLEEEFNTIGDEYGEFRETIEDLDDNELIAALEEYWGQSLSDDNADKILDSMDALIENPSLHNTNKFIKMFEGNSNKFMVELMADGFMTLWNVLLNGLLISCIVIVLLTILTTLFKLTGLAVLAQFLAFIYCLLCGGGTPAIIIFIAYIVLAVLCKILNSSYKKYRSFAE